jgi:hypothetical protein
MRTHVASIAATLNLADDIQRKVCEVIRRFHTGRKPFFTRMLDVQIVGDELVELAEWRDGYSVARWSLTEIKVTWRDLDNLQSARVFFSAATRH